GGREYGHLSSSILSDNARIWVWQPEIQNGKKATQGCPCGYFNDKSRECLCTPPMIQRYVAKISGPLLDRIDIHIEVPAVQYKELRGGAAAEGSTQIRSRVLAARERQRERFARSGEKIYSNAQMNTRQIRAYCELNPDAERLLERAMLQQGLT